MKKSWIVFFFIPMLSWTACTGQGTRSPIPYVNYVQRQAWIDLAKFDSLKAYVPALEHHIDSLQLEIKSLYEVQATMLALITEKDTNINLLLQDQALDRKTITIQNNQLKRSKRKWILILPAAVGGYLIGKL